MHDTTCIDDVRKNDILNIRFISGNRIYLRPLIEADVDGPYPTWLNDEEVCQGTSHHTYPYTRRDALDYVQQANHTSRALILAIVLQEKHLHIGNIALQQINWVYRTADLAILLGDKSQWRKGYGLEAGRLLLVHGFIKLNLNRITCATYENNTGMIKLALSLGMKQEGIRRQAAYKSGQYLDIIEFGLLRKEAEF
ncbi:MAG: hypothetical protein A3F11_03090 [Gammaproteobacteria bacterium RIFCSPHIGHO2_12_FULL_37_14]|nr:MAG: hypothetical protein A3F11_03090 [Gammaproteobacteria bacterium RIFCSPHIGHO2_12_FULL_37_14]